MYPSRRKIYSLICAAPNHTTVYSQFMDSNDEGWPVNSSDAVAVEVTVTRETEFLGGLSNLRERAFKWQMERDMRDGKNVGNRWKQKNIEDDRQTNRHVDR